MQLRVSWSFLAFGCTMILFGVMRANGVVIKPLIILIFTLFVVRLGFYYLAYPGIGADALWFSFPVGSFVSLLLASLVYAHGGWRKAKLLVPVHEEECRETVNSEAEPAGRIAPTGLLLPTSGRVRDSACRAPIAWLESPMIHSPAPLDSEVPGWNIAGWTRKRPRPIWVTRG